MAIYRPLRKPGFTLIEMAIVLGIIGLVAVFFYPSFTRLTSTDKQAQAKRLVQTARDEIVGYVKLNNRFPEEITDIGHHQDPWGNELEYVLADSLTNATNICRYCGTDMNATVLGEEVTNVAFIVWSTGKNYQDDVWNGVKYQVLNRDKTNSTGGVFDDVVEVVSLADLEGKLGGHQSGDDCSDPDLVVCYPMDENTNDADLIADKGPYVLDGSRIGDSNPTLDRFRCPNRAYVFDGDGDYVNGTDDDRLSFTNGTDDLPFSVACWVRVDGDLANGNGLVSKMSKSSQEWKMQLGTGKVFNFAMFSQNQYIGMTTKGKFIFDNSMLGVWYHVVGIYDGSKERKGIKLFIDGVNNTGEKWSDSSTNYNGMDNTNAVLELGRRVDTSHYLNGALDDIRIYDRALNATEIYDLYKASRATYQ